MEQMQNLTEDKPQSPVEEHEETKQKQKKQPKKHKEDKERNQIESPTEDKQKKQKLSHTEDKKKKQKQSPTEDKHKKQIESHTEDKQTKHKLIPAEDKQKKQKINPTEDEQKKQTISPTEDEQKKTPIEEDKQEKQKESLTEDKQTKKKQSPTEDKQKKQTISPTEDEKKKSPVEEDKQEKQKESLTEDKQKKRKQTPSEDKRKKRKLSPTKDKQNKRKQSPTGNKQKYQTVSHTEDKQKKTHREEKQKRIPIDDKQMKQTLSPKENKQKNSPFEEHREEKQKHSPTEDKQEKQKESLTEDKQKKQMESHTEDKQTKHNLTPGEDKQKEQMESLTDDKHKKQKQCPSGDKQKKRKQSPTEDKPKYQTSSHTEDKQTKTHTEEKQIKTPTENKQRKQTLSPKEDKQKNSHFEEDEEEKQKQSPTEDKQEKQKESLTEDKQEKQMDSHTEDKQKKQKRNPSEDKQKTIKPTEDEQKESLTEDKQKKQMESLTEDKQSKHKLSPAEDKQKKQKQSPLEDEQKKRKLSPTEDKQKKRKQSPRENKQKNQTISHTEDKQKKTHTEEKQKMIPTEEKQMKQTLSPKENIQKNSPFEDDKEDKQKQSPTEDKQNKQTINPTEDGHKKQTINPTQDEQKKSPVEEDTSKQEKQKESLTKDKQNNEIEITQTFQQKRKKKHLTEDGPKDQKQSPTEVEQIAQVATIKTKKKKRKKKSQKEDKKQDPTAEMKQQNQHPKEDEVTIKRNKKHKKHLRKTSLNQEDDIIIVNTDSCPEQSPNSDHLDNQIFNTVTFSQIDQSKFYFILSANEWSNITPIIKKYSNGRQVRRLQGKWTDMFSEKVNEIQRGCVLTFKSHNIKSCQSRKISGPYLFASAFCKGFLCGCKYEFKIENEPILKQDVIVNCEIIGIVMHTEEEVNRRNLSGLNRTQAGKEILKSTSVNKYYNNILNANIEEMREGNFTSVPTNEVLRKVVSEVVQKENLHQNIIAEVQVLKECYEKQNDPFIRDIGLDPFTVIMFSDKQMNLLSRLSGQKSLNIYLDATGSIICNIPGQKRPYLYSAVVKPNSDLPPVSVADMLSTQHTIPRIEMFLATFKRSVNLTGKQISIQKIETDYSIALIQASLHTFSCCNLKSYLHKCYEILRTGKLQEGFTIHHLCAMHMIKDFSRQLKKYDSRIKKPKKTFLLQCFAALQNCTTITEAKNVFSDLCTVSLSAALTPRVETALKRLKQKFKQTEDIEDLDDLDDGENILSELEEENLDRKTIKDASPFTPMFQKLATAMTEDIESDANTVNESNSLHCPDVIECLVDKFMSVIPLWSGFMLNINQEGCTEINTRDTNSPVENWFKFVKNDLGLKKRSRPYKVIVALKQVIDAKLTELEFPGCRKKKTTKKINRNIDLKINEEIWKKGTKKKKSLYHTTPSKRKVDRNNTEQGEENPTYPKVMKWGGKHEETYLANTCTIDNVLTILHLKYQECPQFAELVDNQNNAVYNALLTIFKLITEGNYVEAKLVWINHMGIKIKPSTNLYGDEVDYFVKYFDRMWTTYTTSVCNGDSCVNSFISTREINGITMSASGSFHTMQELVDQWITKQQPCKDNNDENSDESCKDIYSIPDTIDTLFRKSDVAKTYQDVQEMKSVFESIIKLRRKLLEELNESRNKAINTIKEFKAEMECILERLEKESTEEVEKTFRKLESGLTEEMKKAADDLDSLKAAADDLRKSEGNNAQQFVSMKNVEKALSRAGDNSRSLAAPTNAEIKFSVNTDICDFLNKLKFFGSVKDIALSSPKRESIYSIKSKRDINIRLQNDISDCNVHGLCLTDDDKLLLADCNNKKLKRVDIVNMSVEDYCVLPDSPYSVCCTSKQEAAVSLSTGSIQFVSLGNQMTCIRQIKLNHVCYGIAYKDDRLFITDSGQSLYMYDLAGNLLLKIQKDSVGNNLFQTNRLVTHSECDDRVYVADLYNGLVTLDSQGKHVNTFTDTALTNAMGVCTDSRGNVFVCGYNSHNVIQIAEDGKKKRGAVVQNSDGVVRPSAICFDRRRCLLFVTQASNNTLKPFELQ